MDVINEILSNNFEIRKSKTVVELGNIFTFQRKGGDSGKLGANNIQFKLNPTKITISPCKIIPLNKIPSECFN